jgi:hypothetical protein
MNKETKYNIAINSNSDSTIFYSGYFTDIDDGWNSAWKDKNFFGFFDEKDDRIYIINWDYVVWVSVAK